jgi:nucleoside-diphosphate-sugar epimerase
MDVFLVGATGVVGSAVAHQLADRGHLVSGFARDQRGADVISAAGATPVRGDLWDRRWLRERLLRADAVIYAAQLLLGPERQLVRRMLDMLNGTGKTFIMTSGTAVLARRTPDGAWCDDCFAEDDPFTPLSWLAARAATEQMVRQAASQGIRSIVIRPGGVYGDTRNGHPTWIYESVEAAGAACYVGRGLNVYTQVHIRDLARLFSLVLVNGQPGALYHAAGAEANFRELARAVARAVGCQTRSLSMSDAIQVFGKFGALVAFGTSSRSRAPRSRRELGWTPTEPDIIEEIEDGYYRKEWARNRVS